MPYKLNDANGYLGHGPTTTGFKLVKALNEEFKGTRPALEQLIEHGHTNLLPALSSECNNLAKKTNNKDIKATLTKLAASARSAEEVLILEL